jgi:excisionase family DNA binding protein
VNTPDANPLDRASPQSLGLKLMLTVEEAAELLGIKRTLMYGLLSTGAVKSVQIGRLRRVRRVDLEEYVTQLVPADTWTEGEEVDAPQEAPRRHQSTQRSRQCLPRRRRTLARQGNDGRTRQRQT